jgi:hypothetical protein
VTVTLVVELGFTTGMLGDCVALMLGAVLSAVMIVVFSDEYK